MKKTKKIKIKEAKALYNAFLKGGGIPPKKISKTSILIDDNINQGRSKKNIEFAYKTIHYAFVICLISLIFLLIHVNRIT
tara:strand:+ start:651 stop:890 length:240 start_codon:yes stop_codon:yes gene_type:complete